MRWKSAFRHRADVRCDRGCARRGVLLSALLAVAGCSGPPAMGPIQGREPAALAVRLPTPRPTPVAPSPEAPAPPAPSVGGRLSDVLTAVLQGNPAIAQARQRWRSAIQRVPQARSLPDPSLQAVAFVEGIETRVGPQEQAFTLVQRIPWPGKLAQAGRVAEEGARIEALRYSAVVRDNLVHAKTTYYEYAYLLRARRLVEQNLGIAHRLAGLGSEMMIEDKALLIDVLKAQSQLAQLQYDLVTLDELISAERTRLNGLMDRPPDAPLAEPPAVPFPRLVVPVERLYDLAVQNREELKIAERMIRQAGARADLARSQSRPDLTIGATWTRIGENRPPLMVPADNGKDAWGVVLGVTIPLWASKNNAAVCEAEADRLAAAHGRTTELRETFTGIKDAYVRLANAERLVLLYRDSLVPQAEQVMQSVEELSKEDRARLGDYLEAQSVWLNFTLAKERALTDYLQAIARLERLTGANLAPLATASAPGSGPPAPPAPVFPPAAEDVR